MPLISVVLPVFGVAPWLPGCLDSILGQSYHDFEVVAIDDCSLDGSGEILDAYAQRDRRVRVNHLARNVGLGHARRAGFEQATGEYVWFVDTDDLLLDGAIASIAGRITELNPDLLILDHERDSGAESRLPALLPVASTPEVFTAAERPAVLHTFHTAWARVVHQELVRRADYPFHAGWYEDVSFTYPLLIAARRISVLHRVCYHYCDRRPGAITATTDERHFEVFDQYERLFATLDRWGVDAPGADPEHDVRTQIFERMLAHYWWIITSSGRVPTHRQRAFFGRMAEHYQRFAPVVTTGRPRHRPGIDDLKRELVAHGSWRTYALLRSARRFGRTAKGRIRGLVGANSR